MFCSASAAGRSPVTTHSTPSSEQPDPDPVERRGVGEQRADAAGDVQGRPPKARTTRRGLRHTDAHAAASRSRRRRPADRRLRQLQPGRRALGGWIAWQLEAPGSARCCRRGTCRPARRSRTSSSAGCAAPRWSSRCSPGLPRLRAGRGERQVALRADAARLVTVRVEDGRRRVPHSTPRSTWRVSPTPAARRGRCWRGWPRWSARADRSGRAARRTRSGRGGRPRGRCRPPRPDRPARLPARGDARRPRGSRLLHVPGPRFGRGLADPDEPVTAPTCRTGSWPRSRS